MEKKKEIYMIGNTHIDPVWLWNRAEGMQEVKSSFSSALDRLAEFEDFKFTHSSISYLEWLSENCPEIFQRIQEMEKAGRWEVAGGMWVEPDSNLPSGESVIRHFLYSNLFVKKQFSKPVETCYNVDSFGHGSNLPAIYADCGIKHYLISRPGRAKCKVPPVFQWTAPNGKKVLTEMTGGEYMAWTRPAIEFNLKESLEALEEYNQDQMAVFYGVGNHGGGPTVDNIHSVHEMIQEHDHLKMKFSTISEFFHEVAGENIPEVRGEIGRIFYGCYSSDNEIKRLNRQAEWTLVKAEAICAMAKYFGGEEYSYPQEKLERAWKEVLFNQFHDVLAGTSIRPARDEAVTEFQYAIAEARKLIHNGVQGIANSMDTRGEGFPLIFINPTGEAFSGVAFADVYVPRAQKKPLRIRDAQGKEMEFAETNYRFYTKESRKGLLLPVKVPAYGYTIYRVLSEGSEQTEYKSDLKAEGLTLSNSMVKVTINHQTGCPESIIVQGKEILSEAAEIKVFEDHRGAWGEPQFQGPYLGSFKATSVELLEENSLRCIIRSCLEYEKSELTLDYMLEKDSPLIKINGYMHNHQTHCQITFAIKIKEENPICFTETGFYKENRVLPDGTEFYQHRFADFTGSNGEGLGIFNTSAYGMRQEGREYFAILSRSSMFARGENGPVTSNSSLEFMDQGIWNFELALLPHEKEVSNKELYQIADWMHMPLEYLGDSNHKGKHYLREQEIFHIEGEGVKASAFKCKEMEEGQFILRVFETRGEETEAKLCFVSKQISITLTPWDIRTYQWNGKKLSQVSMIEEVLT